MAGTQRPHSCNHTPGTMFHRYARGRPRLRRRVPRFSSRHFRSPTLAVGTPPREDRSSEGERSSRVLAVDSPFEGGTEFAAAGGSLALAAAGGLGVLTGVGILLIGTVLIIWGVSELVGHQ